jgi:ABC-2 type transport system ATP-binding protein
VRREIGAALQEVALDPLLSGREHMRLQTALQGVPKAERRARGDALLERVGLADVRDERPGQLTAAERQRAALARALVGGPSLLLADEPAGELEPEEGAHLLMLLREVAHEDGIAVVLFTRDIDDAAAVADSIVELEGGRVVAPAARLAA